MKLPLFAASLFAALSTVSASGSLDACLSPKLFPVGTCQGGIVNKGCTSCLDSTDICLAGEAAGKTGSSNCPDGTKVVCNGAPGGTGNCPAGFTCKKFSADCHPDAGGLKCWGVVQCDGGVCPAGIVQGSICIQDGNSDNDKVCCAKEGTPPTPPSGGKCDPTDPKNVCCRPDGTFYGRDRVCRPACDVCDVAELCTGSSATCPEDGFQSADHVCRAAVSICDKDEKCTGTSIKCPHDTFYGADDKRRCRASTGGSCEDDTKNFCDGSHTCPTPAFRPAGTTCRASDPKKETCDPTETCNGFGPFCPPDVYYHDCPCIPDTVAKFTELFGNTVAPDVLKYVQDNNAVTLPCGEFVCEGKNGCFITPKAEGTVCAAESACAPSAVCDGRSLLCPATFKPAGTVCRPSLGPCDTAEVCTGTSAACPAETWPLANTVCRQSVGICDAPDKCQANKPACTDLKYGTTYTCRSPAGPCDKPEVCDGRANDCPRDTFYGGDRLCRAKDDVDYCDADDYCTGSGPICYDSRYSQCEAPVEGEGETVPPPSDELIMLLEKKAFGGMKNQQTRSVRRGQFQQQQRFRSS